MTQSARQHISVEIRGLMHENHSRFACRTGKFSLEAKVKQEVVFPFGSSVLPGNVSGGFILKGGSG